VKNLVRDRCGRVHCQSCGYKIRYSSHSAEDLAPIYVKIGHESVLESEGPEVLPILPAPALALDSRASAGMTVGASNAKVSSESGGGSRSAGSTQASRRPCPDVGDYVGAHIFAM